MEFVLAQHPESHSSPPDDSGSTQDPYHILWQQDLSALGAPRDILRANVRSGSWTRQTLGLIQPGSYLTAHLKVTGDGLHTSRKG